MRLYPKFRSNLNTVVMPCFILFYEKNGMGGVSCTPDTDFDQSCDRDFVFSKPIEAFVAKQFFLSYVSCSSNFYVDSENSSF